MILSDDIPAIATLIYYMPLTRRIFNSSAAVKPQDVFPLRVGAWCASESRENLPDLFAKMGNGNNINKASKSTQKERNENNYGSLGLIFFLPQVARDPSR